MTYRRWFMTVLLGSTAMSAAANVAAALLLPHGNLPVAVTICVALVPPLALPIAVHSIAVAARAIGAVRGVVVSAVVVVAASAFAASFERLDALATAAGHAGWTSALLPITLDVLAGASAVASVLDPDRRVVSAPVAGSHHLVVPVADTAPAPPTVTTWTAADRQPTTASTARTATPAVEVAVPPLTGHDAVVGHGGHPAHGLHLVPGGDASGEPADRHLAAAEAAVAAGVVVRPPAPVAAQALRLRAAGKSQRAVAEQLGIDRSVISRLEAFAAQWAAEEVV